MSLRLRLIGSYILVLAVTLGVMALIFVLILRTRPAPPQPTYQRLATVAQSIDLASVMGRIAPILNPDSRRVALQTEINSLAAESGVRVLLINFSQRKIAYDSAHVFEAGQAINYLADVYTLPPSLRRGVFTQAQAIFGSFEDPRQQDWLFVALQAIRSGIATEALVFADVQGQQSLQDVLDDFTGALLPLLCQAGLVGGVVAVGLAGLISRTIARPLQGVARAAGGMAAGNYAERVPVHGPTEVRAVAEAFNNMGSQVEGTHKAQQDFLANVSHDLKTPLTSIQGYAQAIIDGAASNPVSAAQIIHEEAARLNRMVEELTDLARLESGRLSFHWSPVDVGRLTSAVAERLSIVAREKNIAMHIDSRSQPEVAGDGDRLAQVLTNLISNAINYTPSGGNVWVKSRLVDGGVQVIVQDDGIGIAPDNLPRVFERFYQVDKARGPRRGTGLGLAIVAEIIQAHSGKISAYSEGEGKGSTFTVWLPSPQMSTVLRKRT